MRLLIYMLVLLECGSDVVVWILGKAKAREKVAAKHKPQSRHVMFTFTTE